MMNYKIIGDGRPLILIHGWAMNAEVWSDLSDNLSSNYQVISIDLRGHGKSKQLDGPFNYEIFAKDIRLLIDKLGLKDLTLIGWSMGVSVILKMLQHPLPSLSSLVFISGNPSLAKRADYENGIPEVVIKRLYKNTERDLEKGLQNFHSLLFSPEELSQIEQLNILKILTDTNNIPKKEAALESLKCLQNEDLRDALAKIAVPTLLIHGKKDQISMSGAALYMKKRIKKSELLLLDDTGHVPFITKEKETLEKIKLFLKTYDVRNR